MSHGDPIQAFWVRSEGRPAWALHRLQCAKGGMLQLDYVDGMLTSTVYRPPSVGERPATSQSEAGDVA